LKEVLFYKGKLLYHEAYRGCMYESQTYNAKTMKLLKLYEKAFDSVKLYGQLYNKHFRTPYAGKPTKHFLWLMNKIKDSKSVPYTEEDLLLMYWQ
jgi:hypothetical protein